MKMEMPHSLVSKRVEQHVSMTALVAIALLSIGAPLLAQIRGIRGTVSDEQGQPLAGVAIVVEIVGISESDTAFSARTIERDQRWQAHTNDKGEYFVRLPHNAVYLLTASEIGFTTLATQIRLSGDGVTAANVRLSRFVPTGRRDQCTTSAALESIERAGRAGAGNPPLARLFTWVASVRIHVPGCHDSPVSQIAQWSHQDLSILLRDLAQLVKFFERIDAGRSEESASIAGGARGALQPDQLVFAIYDRRFTLSELERLLYGSEPLAANQLLTRGAVLHADIAQFATGDLKGAPLVEDGGSKGWRPRTGHWQIGRELLDSIRPNPSNHEDVLRW